MIILCSLSCVCVCACVYRLKKATIEDTDTPKESDNPMGSVMDKIRTGVTLRKTNIEEKKPPPR